MAKYVRGDQTGAATDTIVFKAFKNVKANTKMPKVLSEELSFLLIFFLIFPHNLYKIQEKSTSALLWELAGQFPVSVSSVTSSGGWGGKERDNQH